jgi:adenylate kinase family enzyme
MPFPGNFFGDMIAPDGSFFRGDYIVRFDTNDSVVFNWYFGNRKKAKTQKNRINYIKEPTLKSSVLINI